MVTSSYDAEDTIYIPEEEEMYVHYQGVDYYGDDARLMLEVIKMNNRLADEKEREERRRSNRIIAMVIFGTMIIPVIIYFILRLKYRKEDKLWAKGIYPEDYAFNRDHLLEAYIRLSILMIFRDHKDVKGKMSYISNYIARHFPNHNVDFDFILNHAVKNPVDLQTATAWLNRNLKKSAQRMRIVYFLAGISMVDGTLTSGEMNLLRRINSLLGLNPIDLQKVIEAYVNRQRQNQRSYQGSSKSGTNNRRQKLIDAAKILGVKETASKEEIKRAYRNLAKKYHPDRFTKASKAEQHRAEAKFIEIQEAYELLYELKG